MIRKAGVWRQRRNRPVLPQPAPYRTVYCQVQGCGAATKCGKPYCTGHVALMPYVQTIDVERAAREAAERNKNRAG